MPVHSLNRSLKPSLNHPKPLVYRCGSVCISVSARFRVYRDTRLSVRYCIVLRDQSHAIRGPGCRPFSRPHQDSSPTRTITHLLVFPRKNIENNKLQQITNHLSLVLKSLETNPSSSLYIYILDRKLSVSLELHQLIASNEHTHTHTTQQAQHGNPDVTFPLGPRARQQAARVARSPASRSASLSVGAPERRQHLGQCVVLVREGSNVVFFQTRWS